MSATLLNLPPGSLIDGWQVSKPLGDGGFALVFLGEKNGRHRALKVAQHRESSGDPKQTHARTLRELTALLMLDHPNIVRPQGYGLAESGNLYLALDYVDGWTLAEWAERKHPTVREVLGVFEKLAGALSYAHPSNSSSCASTRTSIGPATPSRSPTKSSRSASCSMSC